MFSRPCSSAGVAVEEFALAVENPLGCETCSNVGCLRVVWKTDTIKAAVATNAMGVAMGQRLGALAGCSVIALFDVGRGARIHLEARQVGDQISQFTPCHQFC